MKTSGPGYLLLESINEFNVINRQNYGDSVKIGWLSEFRGEEGRDDRGILGQ